MGRSSGAIKMAGNPGAAEGDRLGSRVEVERDRDAAGSWLRGRTVMFVVNDPAFFLSHRLNIGLAALACGAKVIVGSPSGTSVAKSDPLYSSIVRAVIRIRSFGFEHCDIPLSRWGGNPIDELRTLWSLIRAYRRCRPDIVHHITIKPVLYGSIASRIVGCAAVNAISGMGHVFVSRGGAARVRRAVVLKLYRLALGGPRMRVIFQNEDDRKDFLGHGLVAHDRTVIVRGSGVNPEEYAPTIPPGESIQILFLGRLLETKGIRDFVGAARILRERGVTATFQVAGDVVVNNPGSVSSAEVEEWRREGIVELLGYVENSKEAIDAAHIVCLPSYREGLPLALIEAASCGRPLVSTDVPGCREIVHHERNGFLVPVRNPKALADVLQRLIASPDLRAKFGAASRQIVLQEGFAEEAVVAATLAVYRDLSASNSTRNSGLP